MKRFLIVSTVLLLLVLAIVVVSFVYIQMALVPTVDTRPTQAPDVSTVGQGTGSGSVTDLPNETQTNGAPEQSVLPANAPTSSVGNESVNRLDRSIPLSSLPLSDTQKDLLKRAGIDYDTFIVTPEMIVCAETRLGSSRFAEIASGNAPGPLEVLSLLRCL